MSAEFPYLVILIGGHYDRARYRSRSIPETEMVLTRPRGYELASDGKYRETDLEQIVYRFDRLIGDRVQYRHVDEPQQQVVA